MKRTLVGFIALSVRLVLCTAASPSIHSGPTAHEEQLTFFDRRITIGYSPSASSPSMDPIERFFQAGLKLSHLRLLTMFDSLGQIRLVAEKLNVTQPAVSKQLAELEAGLGVPVLTRVGNRLFFTPVGETLMKRGREVFHQLEQARFE